ncbi:aminotransferase class IV family protein [Shimia sp. R11_0]|uniref:aminotransferase class IV family protein n=1 Tax=Shimia sp. R11_0 TaxID=2821096 RepID=UPI001ADC982E|nr:aminotransferase class IV family protein [Shimia sp. R11_0]MBO9478966.1 aminotransferase class IV family protein [Shimia sp. R11_0]
MESPLCQSVPAGTRLIETFRYEPGEAVARLTLHLARLEKSAKVLGFVFSEDAVTRAVAALRSETPLRCRLTLGEAGDVEITTAELPVAAQKPWVCRISDVRLSSQDMFLQHKTTRRAIYDGARADLPEGVQEWLFLNEHGELCEGTITNVVLTMPDGRRLTPAVASGCLPGVYRQSLLNAGVVREAVLTEADLVAAERVHLTNALRGEILAVLEEARLR